MPHDGQKRPPGGSCAGTATGNGLGACGAATTSALGITSGRSEPQSVQVRRPAGIDSPQNRQVGMGSFLVFPLALCTSLHLVPKLRLGTRRLGIKNQYPAPP